MDSVKDVAGKAATAVDEGISTASSVTRSTVATAASTASEAYDQAQGLLDRSKASLDVMTATARELQDQVFGVAKHGIEYCIANPAISYPLLGTTLLLALPITRRLLYRSTVGRLVSDESRISDAETRVAALRSATESYSVEAQKLEARMVAAEDEMQRGHDKLKATRQELQRLATTVARSEKVASGVLQSLRLVSSGVPNTLKLRAEAAQKLAALQQQRRALQKYVYQIASKDI